MLSLILAALLDISVILLAHDAGGRATLYGKVEVSALETI